MGRSTRYAPHAAGLSAPDFSEAPPTVDAPPSPAAAAAAAQAAEAATNAAADAATAALPAPPAPSPFPRADTFVYVEVPPYNLAIPYRRDCATAATLFKAIAEAGPWMQSARLALDAVLDGRGDVALELYEEASVLGSPVAIENSLFLHEELRWRACPAPSLLDRFLLDAQRQAAPPLLRKLAQVAHAALHRFVQLLQGLADGPVLAPAMRSLLERVVGTSQPQLSLSDSDSDPKAVWPACRTALRAFGLRMNGELALFGDGVAATEIGVAFLQGSGPAQNPAVALRAFEHGAHLGDGAAAFHLAGMHAEGVVVPRNLSAARSLLEWSRELLPEGRAAPDLYELAIQLREDVGTLQLGDYANFAESALLLGLVASVIAIGIVRVVRRQRPPA